MLIDWSYLIEVTGGDKAFMRDILNLFLEQIVTDVRNLKSILDAEDFHMLASTAHRCKSSIKMLGNAAATELITGIENQAKTTQDKNLLANQITDLVALFQPIEIEIKAMIEKS